MMDESLLCVEQAARDAPGATALIAGDRILSFREIAQLIAQPVEVPRVLVARNHLATAIAIYRALSRLSPLVLIHASLPTNEQAAQAARARALLPDDTAFVLFSSGSTGTPKGIVLGRNAVLASALGARELNRWPGARGVWLCPLPLAHVGGLSILLRSLVFRRPMVLLESFSEAVMEKAFAEHAPSHVSLVPTMLRRLVQARIPPPPALEVALVGGAALDVELEESARAAGYPLLKTYGMTETCSQLITEGRIMPGMELRVREGRLETRGTSLLTGYLEPHQGLGPGEDGWFRTADRARIEDGHVVLLGRADSAILSGGENIDPVHVESVLARFPEIAAACVVGVDDSLWGQRVVALVVAAEGCREILDQRAAAELGFRRPKDWIFVDELPLGPSGKLDRLAATRIAHEVGASANRP